MNVRRIYKLALVLTKSQIRGTQRSKLVGRILSEPRIIVPIDFALLAGLGWIGDAIMNGSANGALLPTVNLVLREALAGIPTAIMFTAIIFGVLYEISQPIQSLSTDLVNWLPLTSLEYVAGSTISEAYIYSFMLCLLLGVALGPALALGDLNAWLASAGMAVLALFLGALVVEILDSTTNRISSSFYKKSGRSGIFFRLIGTVMILVFVQLLFSGYIIGYLLQSVIHAALIAWFVPLVWPTLAVLDASHGDITGFTVFSSLSVVFGAALLTLAGRLRERFWVPVPVSIRLNTGAYKPNRFRLPGIGAVESALILKDLRSLTRRREMMRFLAIPFVIALSLGIPLLSFGSEPGPDWVAYLSLASLYVIPIIVFVGALSMTSVGQEGYAVWNIYVAPIRPSQLLRSKVLTPVLLGIGFSIALLAIFSILTSAVAFYADIMLTVGLLSVLEVSMLGMYFASRFPDFREMVRSRYVGVWGSLLGLAAEGCAAALTLAPSVLSLYLYGSIYPEILLITVGVGFCVFVLAYGFAHRRLVVLLRNFAQ